MVHPEVNSNFSTTCKVVKVNCQNRQQSKTTKKTTLLQKEYLMSQALCWCLHLLQTMAIQ